MVSFIASSLPQDSCIRALQKMAKSLLGTFGHWKTDMELVCWLCSESGRDGAGNICRAGRGRKAVPVVLMQWLQEIVIDGELMPIRYAERFRAAAEIQGT